MDQAALCIPNRFSFRCFGCNGRKSEYLQIPGHAAATWIDQNVAIDAQGHYTRKNGRTHSYYKRKGAGDRKSTRLNSSHVKISYAVFCLKKKNNTHCEDRIR